MKIIHISDVHASRERLACVRKVFDCLYQTVDEHGAELVLFAGDFWDSTITNTRASGFTEYVEMVHRLRGMCQVMFIYGTPKHEPKGSLDVFASIGCSVIDTPTRLNIELPSGMLDILAIPEPRKGDYIVLSQEDSSRMIHEEYVRLSKETKGDNPYIVAFHGEVSGSFYQNGMEARSDTRFPSNLMMSMGADYYALGHIHMPQEPFKGAFYPGSPAPLDFGESHEGTIHLVDLGKETNVTVIPTGAPRFITVEADSVSFEKVNPALYSGNHLRIVLSDADETYLPHAIATDMRSRADLLSCKVIVNRNATTPARSDTMAKVKTAAEKYEEYCKLTHHNASPHAIRFVRSVDENRMLSASHPSKSFELMSISLRGSIGVKCGSGKDDVQIDFTRYNPGVVAMIGDNGRGKTTIIENCHPYPRMLTRKKPLKDHFFLKDSHRILVYRSNDNEYHKIVMNIDAKSKSGSTTYFAYTSRDGIKWVPSLDTDGSLEAYNGYLDKTFGSLELFIRTSFFTRKETRGTPDLTNATKGEKIEFFSSLAGNDWLYDIAELAKEEMNSNRRAIDKLNARLEASENAALEIEDCYVMLDELGKELVDLEDDVSAAKVLVDGLEEYERMRTEQEAESRNSQELKRQLQDNISTIKSNLVDLSGEKNLCDAVEVCRDLLGRMEQIVLHQDDAKAKADIARAEKMDLSDRLSKLQVNMSECSKEVTFYQVTLAEIVNDMRMHEAQAGECGDDCPLCGSRLPKEKAMELNNSARIHHNKAMELRDKADNLRQKLYGTREEEKRLSSSVLGLLKAVEKVDVRLSAAEREESVLNSSLKSVETMMASRTLIPASVLYENRNCTFDLSAFIEQESRLSDLETRLAQIKDVVVGPSREKELASARAAHNRVMEMAATIKGEMKSIKSRIARLRKLVESSEDTRIEVKELEDREKGLSHVQAAFSKTGIPLIELESAIPDIASMANDILEQSYGDRFTISFETVRQGNRKAVDDLNIVVYDRQQGMAKYLDMVCSGEEVWIKQALFYAFAIVRMNRTGFSFMTRFIDESDSSLDTSSRLKYLGMIEAAHRLAGSRLSVLITHSQEIKDVAEQIIEI